MTRKRSANDPVSTLPSETTPTSETIPTSGTTPTSETTPASGATLASEMTPAHEATPTSETAGAAPAPKPSKAAWKTGEQLEYMLSLWSDFIAYQNSKRLARFWPRVYDGWYKRWKFTPPPGSTETLGALGTAESAFKKKNNKVRIIISYRCTTVRPFTSLTRGFAPGSTIRLVRPPRPAASLAAPSCALTEPISENSPLPKLTVPMPGIPVSGRSSSPAGRRRSRHTCLQTRMTPLRG